MPSPRDLERRVGELEQRAGCAAPIELILEHVDLTGAVVRSERIVVPRRRWPA